MDRGGMRSELLASRQRGYAVSLGEYIEGFNTAALPIFDREGNIMLILGVSGIEMDFNRRKAEIVSALIETAASIHLIIDGRPPVDYPSPRR